MATQTGVPNVLPGVYPIAGVTLTMQAPLANGDSIQYSASGDDLIIQFNASGSDQQLVINAGIDPYGRADGAVVAAVPTTTLMVFGPLKENEGWTLPGPYVKTTVPDTGIVTACIALGRAG